MVIAHYFNWFQTPDGRGGWGNWEWKGKGPNHDPARLLPDGRRDIASVYYPLIGVYDSADPAVIEYHMLTAMAAGIDGFVLDWYGIPSDEEKGFAPLLATAQRLGFKMVICFEDKAMFGYHYHARTREEAVANAIRNLTYILDTHATSPAYLRLDGRPVIVNFSWSEPSASVNDQGFSAAEYQRILSAVRQTHDLYFVHDYHCHLRENYWPVCDNVYPWLDAKGDCLNRFYATAREQLRAGRIGLIASLVFPGFDNTGVWGWGDGPYITPRENGNYYKRSWEQALTNHTQFVQIATWNDFGEGATIEPTREYGFSYLRQTQQFAAQLKGGRSLPGDILEIPLTIYRCRVTLRQQLSAKLSHELDHAVEAFCHGHYHRAAAIAQQVHDETHR